MANEIVIKVTLDPDDIDRAGQEIARKLTNALDVGIGAARNVGKKLGEALSAGIELGRGRSTDEAKERAHQQCLEAILAQSAAKIQEIEARRSR